MKDARIQHVIVLMMENRSFDHMIGFLNPGYLDVNFAIFCH